MAFTTASPRYNKRWVVWVAVGLAPVMLFVTMMVLHPWRPTILRDAQPTHLGIHLPAGAKEIDVYHGAMFSGVDYLEFTCQEKQLAEWASASAFKESALSGPVTVRVFDFSKETFEEIVLPRARKFVQVKHSDDHWECVYDLQTNRAHVTHRHGVE